MVHVVQGYCGKDPASSARYLFEPLTFSRAHSLTRIVPISLPRASAAPLRRARRLLGGVFLCFALLVGAHQGEFWPFSIFQMFSSAGQPWTRAIVRDVTEVPVPPLAPVPLADLPGEPVPLQAVGLNQNDLSQYIARTESWDRASQDGLRALLGATAHTRSLLIYRVEGRLGEPSVVVEAVPLLLFAPDTTITFLP